MNRCITLFYIIFILGCGKSIKNEKIETPEIIKKIEPNLFYGIDLNKFSVKTKKIKRGDSFGKILEDNGIDYPEVYEILQAIKGKLNIRKLNIGKSYSLFYSKDSIKTPEYFVYHPGPESFTRIHLRDSLYGEFIQKPIRSIEMEASGVITSSLYETMQNSGINDELTYYLSDIYAWTVDFFDYERR